MEVLVAGREIAGGMIVDNEDAVGSIADGGTEDFAGVDEAVSESADSDLVAGDRVVLAVEGDHVEFFLAGVAGEAIEAFEAKADGIGRSGDARAGAKRDVRRCMHATAKFNACHDLTKRRFADCAADFAEFRESKVGEPFEVFAESTGDFFAGLQGGFTGASGADQDGEEFGEFEAWGAVFEQAFAGTVCEGGCCDLGPGDLGGDPGGNIERAGVFTPAVARFTGFGEFAERALQDELLEDAAGDEGVSIEAGFCDFCEGKFGLVEKVTEDFLIEGVLIGLCLFGGHCRCSEGCCVSGCSEPRVFCEVSLWGIKGGSQ